MGFIVSSFAAGLLEGLEKKGAEKRKLGEDLMKKNLQRVLDRSDERKEERETQYKADLASAKTLYNNYDFSKQEIAVLATQNRLQEIELLAKKLELEKGTKVDPATVVSLTKKADINVPLEDLVKQIVIGDPIKGASRSLSDDLKGRKGVTDYALKSAADYEEQYMASLGEDEAQEMTAYAYDLFDRRKEEGSISLSPFSVLSKKDDKESYSQHLKTMDEIYEKGGEALGINKTFKKDDEGNLIFAGFDPVGNEEKLKLLTQYASEAALRVSTATRGSIAYGDAFDAEIKRLKSPAFNDMFKPFDVRPTEPSSTPGAGDPATNPANRYNITPPPSSSPAPASSPSDAYIDSMAPDGASVMPPTTPSATASTSQNPELESVKKMIANLGIDVNNKRAVKQALMQRAGNYMPEELVDSIINSLSMAEKGYV